MGQWEASIHGLCSPRGEQKRCGVSHPGSASRAELNHTGIRCLRSRVAQQQQQQQLSPRPRSLFCNVKNTTFQEHVGTVFFTHSAKVALQAALILHFFTCFVHQRRVALDLSVIIEHRFSHATPFQERKECVPASGWRTGVHERYIICMYLSLRIETTGA